MSKQEKHGIKGEARTFNVLIDHFNVHKITPDTNGCDFGVALDNSNYSNYAIIQSKYFENGNEVIIRKTYVEDEDGPKTDFFAMLHTDIEEEEVRYFFSAQEIIDSWRLSSRKKGRKQIDYYVFKLSKRNPKKFDFFKGLAKVEINGRIEEGIRKTDEIRNTKNIRQIKGGFKNPTRQIFENWNIELHGRIKDLSIVDKLYICLNEFNDFRRIISWRLIDKITFPENRHTSTFYSQFALKTNNTELIGFFRNVKIDHKISVKNQKLFEGTYDIEKKVVKIIETLRENLIFTIYNSEKQEEFSTVLKNQSCCDCTSCSFDRLNFVASLRSLNNQIASADLWEKMQAAYICFMFGNYEKARELYLAIETVAKRENPILYFFVKYNQKILAFKIIDDRYPDLDIVLDTLNISEEKYIILKSLASNSLYNSYAQSVDETYLKLKDFKQRYEINDTADAIRKQNASIAEFTNFFDGNWLLKNGAGESDLLYEKVIESCIISYSMRTEHSYHLNSFNDFLVQISIHHCNSNKLLGYFQRNSVKSIPYKSETGYLQSAIQNFFSKENVDFLYSEICYFDNRTKNPDLRRRVSKTFQNLCILITYLEFDFTGNDFLEDVCYFIEKLDFNVHDLYKLAHPLLVKPKIFDAKGILRLIRVLLSRKNLYEGYLIVNCLYALREKGYIFPKSEDETVNSIIPIAIKNPRCGLLKAISVSVSNKMRNRLNDLILAKLEAGFNHELFYQSVISNSLTNPNRFIDSYLKFFDPISETKEILGIFYTKSPYTGIMEPLRGNLNKLVEVLLSLNDNSLLENQVIQDIMNKYPYYNFILNVERFQQGNQFDKFWVLENQSEIVLKKLSQNHDVKAILKKEMVEQANQELSKIFLRYF